MSNVIESSKREFGANAGQMGGGIAGVIVALIVVIIITVAVAIPVTIQVENDSNITGTAKTILDLVPVMLALMIFVLITKVF